MALQCWHAQKHDPDECSGRVDLVAERVLCMESIHRLMFGLCHPQMHA